MSFYSISQRKEDLLDKIQILDGREALNGLMDDLRVERNELRMEFQEVTTQEEVKWRQNLGPSSSERR